jgi:hypothetical protein
VVDQHAQQLLGLGQRLRAREVAGGHVEQRLAGEQRLLAERGGIHPLLFQALQPQRTAFDYIKVAPLGPHRLTAVALVREPGLVAELLQQGELEAAQDGRFGLAAAERAHRLGVGIEEARVGVLARRQAHQQLVEVVAADQRTPDQQRLATLPLGTHEGLDLAAAGPVHPQRLEGEQHAA